MGGPSSPPRLAREARRPARVPLTPLIDVVFILLVFFMLASSFEDWRSLDLSAAGPSGGAPSAEGAILVEIAPQGLRLGGVPVTSEELEARIEALLRQTPDRRVLVRPGMQVDVQSVVALLDRLAALGVAEAALMEAR